MEGFRSGRLVVQKFHKRLPKYKDQRDNKTLPFWECLCDCGNYLNVEEDKLKRFRTLSCGCYRKERVSEVNTKHGMTGTETYKTWDTMIQRCTNPRIDTYQYYGKKGITVCDRWLDSFVNFLKDMGERPEGMTLDRIDAKGNYEIENCRWATPAQQSYNKGKQKNNKTGVTGVCWNTRENNWLVQFKFGDIKFSKGYTDWNEAVSKRRSLELQYMGVNK